MSRAPVRRREAVSPARQTAFKVLRRVEDEGAYAADVLDALLRQREATRATFKREDAALATELALGVLRWQRLLDFVLTRAGGARHLEVDALDLEVLLALRLGAYQLLFLERVPASAAVNESVELVKTARKRSAAGLVNALLRNVARDSAAPEPAGHGAGKPHERVEAMLDSGIEPAERLGMALSHPTWLVERWLARWGETETRQLLAANNRAPRRTAALLRAETSADDASARPGRWLKGAIELPPGNPTETEIIRRGRGFVQDEASQMIPLLLEARPGQRVLDLCAAPGGKTARLAQQAGEQRIVAADLHLHRLRRTRDFLQHAGLGGVHLVALDGATPLPFCRGFDRVLVDAPCSGTGTLARNPEIRWRLRPEDLAALAAKQTALLRRGLEHLAPGGRLVYSTCSLEAEENEQVVKAALAGPGGARAAGREEAMRALSPHLLPGADASRLFEPGGEFRTLPWRDGTDGFFAVVVVRDTPGTN